MSWDSQALLAKAKLFFSRALEQNRDDPQFGLWCSLGLELLAKAALSRVSPTLLAESDRDHRHLLHALGRGGETTPKSIGATQAFALCQKLFPDFRKEDETNSTALANRRNEEIHSGSSAFDQYPSGKWLSGFYVACDVLSVAAGTNIDKVLGKDEAKHAREVLAANKHAVEKDVNKRVATHRGLFDKKSRTDRKKLGFMAGARAAILSREQCHRVACPACGSWAVVQGETFGTINVTEEGSEIVTRQAVSPRLFECFACELKLNGYAELEVVQLGGTHTRTSRYAPADYYGLVDLDTVDWDELISERFGPEYDNE